MGVVSDGDPLRTSYGFVGDPLSFALTRERRRSLERRTLFFHLRREGRLCTHVKTRDVLFSCQDVVVFPPWSRVLVCTYALEDRCGLGDDVYTGIDKGDPKPYLRGSFCTGSNTPRHRRGMTVTRVVGPERTSHSVLHPVSPSVGFFQGDREIVT